MLTTPLIYDRGIALYEMGAVSKTHTKGLFLVGSYTVDTRLDTPCQCGYSRHNPEVTCKHTVAVLRKMLDDLMYPANAV